MAETTAVDPIETAEEGFDVRRVGRAALWATLAIVAMLAAILAARSDAGVRRITVALNGMPPFGQFSPTAGGTLASVPARDPVAEAETRRLAESVRRLTTDRDRLMARLETLERSIDVTGALPPAASQQPPEAPAAATAIPETPAASPIAAAEAATESSISRTEFGIDLGGAANSEALRALWSTVKAQHGALLEGLQPVATTRETDKPGATELRLVAGPLLNAAAAARLCAVLAGTGRACQPSIFEGQRQALR